MNALRRMHAALRPGGWLLDLHPDALHSPVELRVGDVILPLGRLDDSQHLHDVRLARAARQVTLDAGLFALERETRFTFVTHFDTVENWLSYMAEHMQKVVIPTELAMRARALPPGAADEVRIARQVYGARLRRTGASG